MSAAASELQVRAVLQDQSASQWLKTSLHTALERDPLDALNDALVLVGLLEDRLREALGIDDDS